MNIIRQINVFLLSLLVSSLVLSVLFAASSISNDKVYDKLIKATAHVQYGTGFYLKYKNKTYLVTNAHICNRQESRYTKKVYLITGKYEIFTKLNVYTDICVSQTTTPNLIALTLGDKNYKNQELDTFGFPSDVPNPKGGRRSHGILKDYMTWSYNYDFTDVSECEDGTTNCSDEEKECPRNAKANGKFCRIEHYQAVTSLYSVGGSSGSPVVDDNGNLVGIIASSAFPNEFAAGIVPLQSIKEFLDTL